MAKADFFSILTAAISGNRFTPYLINNPNSQSEAYGTYLWNIALCESLYPALNCLEISLRNSIHDAAVQEFGVADWFQSHLHLNELEPLNNLANGMRQGHRSVSANDLIANLTLGFWLSLFRSRYEQVLWPKLLEPVFPYWEKQQRTRRNAYARLDSIRHLRNRVFHHEPIWYLQDLEQQHEQILETIGWISPAMLAMTRLLDRFDSVYTRWRTTLCDRSRKPSAKLGALETISKVPSPLTGEG